MDRDEFKARILKKFDSECQNCKRNFSHNKNYLILHRINSFLNDSFREDNVTLLCKRCKSFFDVYRTTNTESKREKLKNKINLRLIILNSKLEKYPEYHERLEKEEIKEINLQILKRDDFTCKICERKKYPDNLDLKLTVHHIITLDRGGTYDENNLVTLCSKCHDKLHKYETHKELNKAKFELTEKQKQYINLRNPRIKNKALTTLVLVNKEINNIKYKKTKFTSEEERMRKLKSLKRRRSNLRKKI